MTAIQQTTIDKRGAKMRKTDLRVTYSGAALTFVLVHALFVVHVRGQDTRGMIFGTLTDPSAAPVAGATITVTQTETNVAQVYRTNETGYYEASLLRPGNYVVAAEAPGFKRAERRGIALKLGRRTEVNFSLELGSVGESIVVSGDAPLLETDGVSAGRVVDSRSIVDLPVARNNPTILATFTPGIQSQGFRTPAHLAASIVENSLFLPGRVGTNEILIDGGPNIGNGRRMAYLPHTDAVEEFKVETSNVDASTGHAIGASISMMTKAGTNELHGALTQQHSQVRWNATPFLTKQAYYRSINEALAAGDSDKANRLRNLDPRTSGRSNNYSISVGGPVVVPRLINGRNRLFFFGSFNGTNERNTESNSTTVNNTIPSLENRRGDFSRLLTVDPVRYQLHDPLSTAPDPSRPTNFIRTPMPGNIIPASRMVNPAATFYTGLLPTPNNEPLRAGDEPSNNYLATNTPWNFNYYAVSNRLDYHHSAAHRFFLRWNWSDFLEHRADWSYFVRPGLHAGDLRRHNVGGAFDWVYTISPSTLLNLAVGENEYRDGQLAAVAKEMSPSQAGLPGYLDAAAGDRRILPLMSFNGYRSLGRGYTTYVRARVRSIRSDVSSVRGSHSLRAGFSTRQYFRASSDTANTAGAFTFTNAYTRRHDDTFTPAGDLGHSWAAFLMGLPTAATFDVIDSYAGHSPSYGWFVQDSWRVTSRLTFNLGFRLEHERGATERYNRAIGPFDPSLTLPISNAVEAAYTRSPVAELAASSFRVRGGNTYPGAAGASRNLWGNQWMPMPRLGVSWQVARNTVLRAGYGVSFDSLNVAYIAPDQFGFSSTTATNLTNDFGANWLVGDPRSGVSPLRDPFPVRADGTRFDQPIGSSLGAATVAGRSFSYMDYGARRAHQGRWRVGLQRQIGSSMVVEAAYVGAATNNVNISRPMNPLPEQYWAGGVVRNVALASNLDSNVRNPFHLSNLSGLASAQPALYRHLSANSFYQSPIIRKSQLLRPDPHMTGLTDVRSSTGRVRSHSLELVFNRRFAQGFNFSAGYSALRLREADLYLNEFDPAPSFRESNDGRPHRFTATSVFELPFGKGKRFLDHGPLAFVAGGWQIGLSFEYQPGPLVDFPNLFFSGDLGQIAKNNPTFGSWFNTGGFERFPARGPANYHRRVFPTRVGGVRGPSLHDWNGNVQRDFRLSERFKLQLRLDALDMMNRSQLMPPNADPYSTNFGRVISQWEMPNRYIHIQARIRF